MNLIIEGAKRVLSYILVATLLDKLGVTALVGGLLSYLFEESVEYISMLIPVEPGDAQAALRHIQDNVHPRLNPDLEITGEGVMATVPAEKAKWLASSITAVGLPVAYDNQQADRPMIHL